VNRGEKKPIVKLARVVGAPGQHLTVIEETVVDKELADSPVGPAVARLAKAYREAAKTLVAGKFAAVNERVPLPWRHPCHIWVFACRDGVLVRYDRAPENEEPKTRYSVIDQRLQEAAPIFSENLVHVPDDAASYVIQHPGPAVQIQLRDATGNVSRADTFYPMILGKHLPTDGVVPGPPAPPPRLVSINKEFRMQLCGEAVPTAPPPSSVPSPRDQFILDIPTPLSVGWDAIEIYPILPEVNFDPSYAPLWAEIDIQNAVAQTYVREDALNRIDSRAQERQRKTELLNQFQSLLNGPEEPVHQFLKSHPDILAPLHERIWSKLPFGDRISDFVVREIDNDYVLVEIEAPTKLLFRKDGRPRSALQAPIDQTRDWLLHLADHRLEMVEKYGLTGISVTPRTLVVIGRSKDLTERDRARMRAIEQTNQKLRIRTYDDILAEARVIIERALGPTQPSPGPGARIYWAR
jgi:hypothetical protein